MGLGYYHDALASTSEKKPPEPKVSPSLDQPLKKNYEKQSNGHTYLIMPEETPVLSKEDLKQIRKKKGCCNCGNAYLERFQTHETANCPFVKRSGGPWSEAHKPVPARAPGRLTGR